MSMSLNQEFTPLKLLRFAAPSIIMMIFMSMYTIIDGMFVSRFVGSNALSATNIVYPVVNIMIAIATMMATGGNAGWHSLEDLVVYMWADFCIIPLTIRHVT